MDDEVVGGVDKHRGTIQITLHGSDIPIPIYIGSDPICVWIATIELEGLEVCTSTDAFDVFVELHSVVEVVEAGK